MRFDTRPEDAPPECPETVLYLEGFERSLLINNILDEAAQRGSF